jgi:hypothetical protein
MMFEMLFPAIRQKSYKDSFIVGLSCLQGSSIYGRRHGRDTISAQSSAFLGREQANNLPSTGEYPMLPFVAETTNVVESVDHQVIHPCATREDWMKAATVRELRRLRRGQRYALALDGGDHGAGDSIKHVEYRAMRRRVTGSTIFD